MTGHPFRRGTVHLQILFASLGFAALATALTMLVMNYHRPLFWLVLALGVESFALEAYAVGATFDLVFDSAISMGFVGLYFRSQMKVKASGVHRKVVHDDDTIQVSIKEIMNIPKQRKGDDDAR
jgi:hypothetical protein